MRKLLLIVIIILLVTVVGSSLSYVQLVYSHLFVNATICYPGLTQYDNWQSFRAFVPLYDIQSITMRG